MDKTFQILKKSLKIGLATICVVHISFIGQDILHPSLPNIVNYQEDLENIEFPISLLFCVDELRF